MLKKQQGIGLIEVMVAAVITAIGILGYAGMQIQTLSETSNAQHRMQALALAGDLVSRVRANTSPSAREIYINANYQPDQYSSQTTLCQGNICTAEQLASSDLNALRQQLGTLLPSAAMTLSPSAANGTYMVRVSWSGKPATATQCDAPGLNEDRQYESHCVVLEVSI